MSIAPDSKTPLTPAIPTELMRLPVGVVSPLWGLFAGAAVTGAAWWWMTRWTRPENLEAMFAQTTKATNAVLEAVEAEVAALPEPVIETPPVVEAVAAEVEPVMEAAAEVVEATAEPVAEAVEAASEVVTETVEAADEPVVEAVEAAPEPVIEAVEAAAEVPETLAEALAEAPAEFVEAVGGKSAPISPVLEAMSPEAAPAPKKRKAAPKAVELPTDDA